MSHALYIPKILQNAIFGLLLFTPRLRKKVHNSAGYSSLFCEAWTKKSSRPKHSILKYLGYKYWLFMMWLPSLAHAEVSGGGHVDPITSVIFWVTLLFFLGFVGRYIAQRLNQPSVLGELLMGIVFGNVFYFLGLDLAVILREGAAIFHIMRDMLLGAPLHQAVEASIRNPHYVQQVITALNQPSGIDLIKIAYVVDIFSRYGVIFLLFMVGLESSVEELKRTGKESFQVAVIGVLAPIFLGLLCMYFLIPEASFKVSLFVAATLSATSVGITARVLKELKKIRTREARTILGAAMIDDILGLIILAIVSSIVISDAVNMVKISSIIFLALAFLFIVLFFGPWLLKKAVKLLSFMEPWETKLIISFAFVMCLAWLAALVQLAPIIGAFAAGVVIHDGFFDGVGGKSTSLKIKDMIAPFESLLAPLFFVLIGIQVKLESFVNWEVVLMSTGLIVAAILGKLISGFGGSRKDDRLLIGVGMLPRGEVGLVFASIGITLGVISDQLFSSIVLMVIVTTFIAPIWLKARYNRQSVLHEAK
jgi:Kef-type K+ transport system membrane component KefB